MATNLATPGVYIEEKSSFGSSVVPVQTAVPAFIGYTEKANRGSKSLLNQPTKITSFGQFVELFGMNRLFCDGTDSESPTLHTSHGSSRVSWSQRLLLVG